jgi:hypothetical protein
MGAIPGVAGGAANRGVRTDAGELHLGCTHAEDGDVVGVRRALFNAAAQSAQRAEGVERSRPVGHSERGVDRTLAGAGDDEDGVILRSCGCDQPAVESVNNTRERSRGQSSSAPSSRWRGFG